MSVVARLPLIQPCVPQGNVNDSNITLEGGVTQTVAEFIESYFGFQYYYVGICAGALLACAVLCCAVLCCVYLLIAAAVGLSGILSSDRKVHNLFST